MKLKECENCYYEGLFKCFLYDEVFENLKMKECKHGFLDPYKNNNVDELCKNCDLYENNQCTGNRLQKEYCIFNY